MRRPTLVLAAVALGVVAPSSAVGHLHSRSNVTAAGEPSTTPRTPAGENIKHPDYTGSFAGEERSSLAIKVTKRSRRGQAQAGLFQPKSITVTCDGEPPEREYRFPPFIVYFHN